MNAAYWDERYRAGGDSGDGSKGVEGAQKAAYISQVIAEHDVQSVVDWGCGDGTLLAQIELGTADYVGLDLSPTAIIKCLERFPQQQFARVDPQALASIAAEGDLALSISVIWHLVDDDEYEDYLAQLFGNFARLVLVYCSNVEQQCQAPHMRHRAFVRDVPDRWELIDTTVRANAPDDDLWREGFYLFERLQP